MNEDETRTKTSGYCSDFEIDNKNPRSSTRTGWSPARVKFELAERGHTLTSLARDNGYHQTAGSRVLRTPWPAMEEIIAAAVGVSATDIWPERYDPDTGIPKSYLPRKRRRMGRPDVQDGESRSG